MLYRMKIFLYQNEINANIKDRYTIPLTDNDFTQGALKVHSNIRPNIIFTADKSIVLYKIGYIKKKMIESVIEKIFQIFKS